jgi:hypothetical protein
MTKRPKANWARLREQLWARCGGRCEVSGTPLDFETFDAHRRRNKGMGGTSRLDTDLLSNLLALDPTVHNGGPGSVHADRADVSGPRGWLVSKLSTEPLDRVPVLIAPSPSIRQWSLLVDQIRVPLGPPIALGYVYIGSRLRLPGLVDVEWTPEEQEEAQSGSDARERMRRELAAAGQWVRPQPLPVLYGPCGRIYGKLTAQQRRQLTHGEWPDPERPN